MPRFVSRGGEKLQFALDSFGVVISDKVVSDFGSSTGGFTDCLLQNGAKKVYAVEVAFGALEWKLRNDYRVVVMERTNAMHVTLPEKMDVITIDVGWTRQASVLPNAFKNLKEDGLIISLIKPHYEASERLIRGGKLIEESLNDVLAMVKEDITKMGGKVEKLIESPIVGERAGNREFLALVKPT